MSRADEARRDAIERAKVSQRPLNVWPRDVEELQLQDLPIVADEYVKRRPPHQIADIEALVFEVGNSYGMVHRRHVGIWK